MKTKFMAVIMALFSISGCAKDNNLDQSSDIVTDESSQVSIEYDIEEILAEQKIIFIMSVSSYDNPYSAGYFIDEKGVKHIYELYNQRPFESIEKEYAYLLEHYDEFETTDFFDDSTFKTCIDYLYHVNADSEIRKEGQAIMDAEIHQLYGIRLIDDNEEFVWLGSEPGIKQRLNDSSSDQIFELFGDNWYVW